MPDISLNFGPRIDRADLRQLRDNLKELSPGDEVKIRIEAADAHQAGEITDELVRQGFDYQPKGGDGTDFYFIAKKLDEARVDARDLDMR